MEFWKTIELYFHEKCYKNFIFFKKKIGSQIFFYVPNKTKILKNFFKTSMIPVFFWTRPVFMQIKGKHIQKGSILFNSFCNAILILTIKRRP